MEMKNLFKKLGAGATALTMVCSFSAVAFADDEAPVEEPTAVEDAVIDEVTPTEAPADVEEPKDVVDETPVDDENCDLAQPAEVVEPAETAGDADVDLAASAISFDDSKITKNENSSRIAITIPYSVSTAAQGDQITALAYDVTNVANPTPGSQYEDQVKTPIAHIDQFTYTADGNLIIYLSTTKYNGDSKILVKMGGTGITTPAATLFTIKDLSDGGSDVTYGDVNGDTLIDMDDAIMIYDSFMGDITLSEDQKKAANVSGGDDSVDMDDAILIYDYFMGDIKSFPAENK